MMAEKAPLFRRFLKALTGRILTNSGFIAAVLGVCAFLLLDFSPEPYVFDKQYTRRLSEHPRRVFTYYADLNMDGNQERFIFSNGLGLNASIVVYKVGDIALDQWNFLGSLQSSLIGYFVGNYDHDRSLEIAAFSLKEKTIYLNFVEPYGDTTHLVKNILIDTVRTSDFNTSLSIDATLFCDLNADGFDELLFSVSVGHARQPRKIYAYDIKADSLWRSPDTGIMFNDPIALDYDQDGKNEIFAGTSGSNNYPEGGISYPDTVSWFVVLDDRLEFKVPPVACGGLFSRTIPLLLEKNGKSSLFYLVTSEKDLKYFSDWYQLNTNLSLEAATPFPDNPGCEAIGITRSASGRVQQLLTPLQNKGVFVENGLVSDSVVSNSLMVDFKLLNYSAGIPQFEYATVAEADQEKLTFLNGTGEKMGTISLDYFDEEFRACWAGKVNDRFQLLVSSLNRDIMFTVRPNPWQYWQYLILIGLIGGFYAFIALIRFIQSQQFARQESMRKEVLELQLKAVRNQLDPHFTFNALNSLSALSMTGDTKGVDQFIGYFSRLLRTHLNTSDKILVSLKEEIEFVVNYVELQRIRFENAFGLELDIPKDIDLGRVIPKMMIQTHVENAIKHGFTDLMAPDRMGSMDGGARGSRAKILVKIREEGDDLLLIIEDNGAGRGNSATPKFESTGIGIMSLDKIRESVRQLYGIRIQQDVEDLVDQAGQPAGTRITIRIIG